MATGSGIWCMRPIPRWACGSTTTSSSHPTTQRGLSAFEPHGDGGIFTMFRRLIHQLLGLLICFVVLAIPAAVAAQDGPPTIPELIVTVRDVNDRLLAGLTVQIRAGADTPVLSEARTNAQGQAVFATISVSQVRVHVTGTLASGAQ